MLLYLVRHGPAGERDPDRWPDDTQRPLSKTGFRKMKKAARGLRRIAPEVDVVLSSPSLRAWQTAEMIHKHGGWPEPVAEDVLRVGPPGAVLAALARYEDHNSIALVGHEPYIGRIFAAVLTPGAMPGIEVKKGAVIALEVSNVRTFAAPKLLWFLQPGALRRLAR